MSVKFDITLTKVIKTSGVVLWLCRSYVHWCHWNMLSLLSIWLTWSLHVKQGQNCLIQMS